MGAWIEICIGYTKDLSEVSRTPRWVRGLKLSIPTNLSLLLRSHPTMGAWIEILNGCRKYDGLLSHPTMGAWIEILIFLTLARFKHVAPHDGCVD